MVSTVYSPLRSEKASSSVVAQIQPLFPLQTSINYREDLTLEGEQHFYKAVTKLLEQKEPLGEFADL